MLICFSIGWVSTGARSLRECREVFFLWCPWSGLGDVPLAASPAASWGRADPIFGSSTTLVWSQKWLQRSQGYHGGWLYPGGLSLAYRDVRAGQIQLGDHDLAGMQVGVAVPSMAVPCSTSWLRLAS